METTLRESPSARTRSGKVLRHWTTNDRSFVGKATANASEKGDWGLADSRRRNLVASTLKSLSYEAVRS